MCLNYEFEEFAEHFQAMQTVRQYEEIRTSYGAGAKKLHVGKDRSRAANLLRLVDYFAQTGQEPDAGKLRVFVDIYDWLSKNFTELVESSDGWKNEIDESGEPFDFRTPCLRATFEGFRRPAGLPRATSRSLARYSTRRPMQEPCQERDRRRQAPISNGD